MKPRAAAILIENGQAAMIERHRGGRLYFVFPGGHVEPGELPEQAVVREVKEELGLDVQVVRLVARSTYMDRPHDYFLVEKTGGIFGSGTGKELTRPADSERGSVTPVWLLVADFDRLTILPEQMALWVSRFFQSGWPEEIFEFIEQEDS
jgi:8-oxo-dGTP diphosphatase